MDLHLTRSSMGGSASLRSASWADGSEKDCRWATPLLFVRRCGSSTAFNKRLWHTQHLRWDQPMPLNVQNWPGSADEIVQQWDMKKRKIDLLVRMRSANGRWAIRVFFYEDWNRKIFVKRINNCHWNCTIHLMCVDDHWTCIVRWRCAENLWKCAVCWKCMEHHWKCAVHLCRIRCRIRWKCADWKCAENIIPLPLRLK